MTSNITIIIQSSDAAPANSDTANKQIRRINGKHNNAISLLALPRGAPHHESDQSRRSISVISADQRVANPRPHELPPEPLFPPERLLSKRTPAQREVNSTNRETSVLLPYSSGTTSGTTPSSTPRTITGTSALKPEHLHYRPKYLRTTSEVHPKNIWHYSPPSRLNLIPYVIKQREEYGIS